MSKKALIVLADGFEEIEALCPIDILRRAGVNLTIAGLTTLQTKSSRGVTIVAETTLPQVIEQEFDALILPGGMPGAAHLASSPILSQFIVSLDRKKKLICAICASPSLVLAPTGILKNKSVTGYPGMLDNFDSTTKYTENNVVTDGHIITSRGPGTAMAFGFAITHQLVGLDVTEKIRRAMLAA